MGRRTSLLHIVLDPPEESPPEPSTLDAVLASCGVDVRLATTSDAALAALEGDAPEVVLVRVPRGDERGLVAFDVMKRLRARGVGADAPFVLIARDADHEAALLGRALAAGATDVVAAEGDASVLRARLRRVIEDAHARAEVSVTHAALAERSRKLEALRREQHELMEFLAHDLKNPMMVVAGNLEWIRSSEGMTARVVEAVDDARYAAARIRSMVENFLMVSRLEHAELPLSPERIEVDALLTEVAAGFAERARTQQVAVSLQVDPGLSVSFDSVLLHRVIKNMVDAALRNTPVAGRVSLEAHRGDGVEIAISNSGSPMPAALRAHLFDKLARPSDPSTMLEDAGLGLYFCKCAVEAHSGHISVFETGDWPTSFVIQLPSA